MKTPVVFRCPLCAGAFRVQPARFAQQVRCAHCRGIVLVPATEDAADESAEQSESAPSPGEVDADPPIDVISAALGLLPPGTVKPAAPSAAEPAPASTMQPAPPARSPAENRLTIDEAQETSERPPGSVTPRPSREPMDRAGAAAAARVPEPDAEPTSRPGLLEELLDASQQAVMSPSSSGRGLGERDEPIDVPPLSTANSALSMQEILAYGRALKVSDIHVAVGAPVMFRMARRLVPVTAEPLTSAQAERLSVELLSEYQRGILRERRDFDLMAVDDFGRYRVNVGYFDGDLGTVIRILSQRPKTLAELQLPDVVRRMTLATKGLVLITGSASQGKTTTLTGMIDEINRRESRHIITIEDPIEYLHPKHKGLVRQRQIGSDTQDFSSGLRAALRQNPDVITIGEMRDYETIKIALTAAETGCLVISTLHILSIDKIIERLLSFAPAEDEGFIRYVLADTLVGVVHQELLPAIDGGKRVACEVLVCTPATRNIIRSRGTYFLRSTISTGRRFGMIPMQSSVQQLLDEGTISQETAALVMANYQ